MKPQSRHIRGGRAIGLAAALTLLAGMPGHAAKIHKGSLGKSNLQRILSEVPQPKLDTEHVVFVKRESNGGVMVKRNLRTGEEEVIRRIPERHFVSRKK